MVKANSQCVAIVRAIRRFKKSAALPIGDGDYQSVPSLYRNVSSKTMISRTKRAANYPYALKTNFLP